jgi:hypothetical protein
MVLETLLVAAQLRITISSGNFVHIVQHGIYFTAVVGTVLAYANLGFYKDSICSFVNQSLSLNQELGQRFLCANERISTSRIRERVLVFILIVPMIMISLVFIYGVAIMFFKVGFDHYKFEEEIRSSGVLLSFFFIPRLIVSVEAITVDVIEFISLFFLSNTLFWTRKAW